MYVNNKCGEKCHVKCLSTMNVMNDKNISASKKAKDVKSTSEEWDANKIVFRVLLLVSCFKILLTPT